jgi:hypothetical protein
MLATFGLRAPVALLLFVAMQAVPIKQMPIKQPVRFCGEKSQQYTGFIALKGVEERNLFYWLAERDNGAGAAAPLIMWLGDGCSVLPMLLQNNGPCSLSANETLTPNTFSWTRFANVLWVDQITGVGFSNGGTRNSWSAADVAKDVVAFLEGFLIIHPRYRKRSLFVFGEGLAGQMVPQISHTVARHFLNSKLSPGNEGLQLKGIALGSSTIDPLVTFPQRPQFALHNPYRIILLKQLEIERIVRGTPNCAGLLKKCRTFKGSIEGYEQCTTARHRCSQIYLDPVRGEVSTKVDAVHGKQRSPEQGRDVSDIRERPPTVRHKWCAGVTALLSKNPLRTSKPSGSTLSSSSTSSASSAPTLEARLATRAQAKFDETCGGLGRSADTFLQKAGVQRILGVLRQTHDGHDELQKPAVFTRCNKQVDSALFDVWAQSSTLYIRLLLEDGVRLLDYHGDADYEHACGYRYCIGLCRLLLLDYVYVGLGPFVYRTIGVHSTYTYIGLGLHVQAA